MAVMHSQGGEGQDSPLERLQRLMRTTVRMPDRLLVEVRYCDSVTLAALRGWCSITRADRANPPGRLYGVPMIQDNDVSRGYLKFVYSDRTSHLTELLP